MEPAATTSTTPLAPADARLEALIDLLLTVGYVDGQLHHHEHAFIRGYLARLVEHVAAAPGSADAWRGHFDAVFARLDAEVAALAAEVVATGDAGFVPARLKVRAVALFQAFAPAEQASALELLRAVAEADGTVSPAERALHDELVAHLHPAPPAPPPVAVPARERLVVTQPAALELIAHGDPLLDPLEQRYADDPATRHAQLRGDYELVFGAINAWERQRARGNGRLMGVTDVDQLAPGTNLLDGHVHVLRPDRPTELIVLGDLHGCYGCLKAAVLQSDFVARARRHQQDPAAHPDVKLVLLGDYLDRGRFGFEGVLRAALQLLVAFPAHVILLRGNHEFLVRVDGQIVSAVNPAEAVPALAAHAPLDVLDAYRHLFEHMPTSLVFDRTLLVHGGVPRDETTAARYRDLSSLDDLELRFEMMWSDPAGTDHVPVELQRETPRFSFGRDQFRLFMERVGCHTMIRGHEQIDAGFKAIFDVADRQLLSVFSAGGHDNPDLPGDSRYRTVTPMALSVRHHGVGRGEQTATPWPLRYQPFGHGAHNGLHR